jgi:peptide chain release factor subunit 1
VEEQRLLQSLFDLIVVDGAYCYSAQPTIDALEQGLIETLIVWEELSDIRYELVSTEDAMKTKVVIKAAPSLLDDQKKVQAMTTFPGYEIVSSMPLLDWIFEHHKDFGAKLKLVSSVTSIGNQFVNGFGGLGGMMRFKATDEVFEGPAGENEDTEDSEESVYDYEY